ncbi:hypothetical protein A6A04_13350 [Paramagnetospirillum marisnigri]|uniref:Uncharacterized protein n=1 Tax=Paramagnetospirillum marisnigri TaxID=1285242 RepID=A0A178MWN3_9PROT|nr:hypothetical protein [Paramagnetospirillum marisnigri]OAN53873.1 hypothetical protein A6A04_13350 [Paramagnetospirillum marisnigri]
MTTFRNAQQRAADSRRDVMASVLTAAAREGRVCPSLKELGAACGCSLETASNDLRALHAAGRITIKGGEHYRVVTVGAYSTAMLLFDNRRGDALLLARENDGAPTVSVSRLSPDDFSRLMVERGYRFEDSAKALRHLRRVISSPAPLRSSGVSSIYDF